MQKRFRIFLLVVAVAALLAFAAYSYIMTGGARDVATETAAYSVTTDAILAEFAADEAKASAKYINKPVALAGKVSAFKQGEAVLGEKVVCTLKDSSARMAEGTDVTLKGRVVGYDSLLEELKLDQCTITNQ